MTTTTTLPAAGRLLGAALAGLLMVASPIPAAAQGSAASAPGDDAPFQSSRAAETLPMPEEIFERYIEAMGGWDKINALQNRRITGTFEGDPFEFKASVKIWWEADGRYHLNIREPAGLFYDLYAVDGMTWSVVMGGEPNPIGNVQRLEILDTADFLGEANYRNRYKEIETQREAKAGDTPVYVVKATTRGGRPHTLFFDKNTGLLIGDRVPDQGPDGKMRLMTVRIENYREFGGVLYPTRFVQTFSDNARPNTMNFNEIEVNADDEHDYTVPDSVRERFDSAKKAEQEAAGAQGDG